MTSSITIASPRIQALPETMRAVTYRRYGSPEELRIEQVRVPTPGPTQVLVRVAASSINALDRRMLRADPFLVRLDNGLFRPSRRTVLGADFAGEVVAVGASVTAVRPGDRVFGHSMHDALGAFAEYVCVEQRSCAPLPCSRTERAAASLALAGATALQAARDIAKLTHGHRVLIHGSGGAVGGYLLQICKAYGAHVTAVCSERSVAICRSMGADEVYTLDQRRSIEPRHHALFVVNGRRPMREHLAHLRPNGRVIMIGGTSRQIFEALLSSMLTRRVRVLTLDPSKIDADLRELRARVDRGQLTPMVSAVRSLDELAQTLGEIEAGRLHGKVVIEP